MFESAFVSNLLFVSQKKSETVTLIVFAMGSAFGLSSEFAMKTASVRTKKSGLQTGFASPTAFGLASQLEFVSG